MWLELRAALPALGAAAPVHAGYYDHVLVGDTIVNSVGEASQQQPSGISVDNWIPQRVHRDILEGRVNCLQKLLAEPRAPALIPHKCFVDVAAAAARTRTAVTACGCGCADRLRPRGFRQGPRDRARRACDRVLRVAPRSAGQPPAFRKDSPRAAQGAANVGGELADLDGRHANSIAVDRLMRDGHCGRPTGAESQPDHSRPVLGGFPAWLLARSTPSSAPPRPRAVGYAMVAY